jgi:hypothetical protein
MELLKIQFLIFPPAGKIVPPPIMHENWQPCGSQPFLALKAQEDHVLMTQTSGACILTRSDDGQLEALYTDLTNYSLPIVDLKYEQGQLWPLHSLEEDTPATFKITAWPTSNKNSKYDSETGGAFLPKEVPEDTQQARRAKYNRRRMLIACCFWGELFQGCEDCLGCNYCATCTAGWYPSPIPWTSPAKYECKDCSVQYHPNCTSCSTTACLTCEYPWEVNPFNPTTCRCSTYGFLSGDECKRCLDGCAACTSAAICTNCKPFHTLDGGGISCTPCKSGCDVCAGASTCQTCLPEFVQSGPANNVVCTACSSNQYWTTSNACLACDTTKCTTCKTNSTFCTSCGSGKILLPQEGVCLSTACTANQYFDFNTNTCKACDSTCTGCNNGYGANNECKTCNMANSTKLFREDQVSGRCMNFDKVTDPLTFIQWSGDIGSKGWMGPMTFSRFTSRIVGYLPKSMTISTNGGGPNTEYGCGIRFSIGSPTCTFCGANYAWSTPTTCGYLGTYLGSYPTYGATDQYQGLSTSYNCDIAVSGIGCIKCIEDAFVNPTGGCTLSCPLGYFWNSTLATCIASTPLCTTFTVANVCTQCQIGYFYNSLTLSCLQCYPGCKTCSSALSTGCIDCQAGYHKASTGVCKMRCPAGFYHEISTAKCLNAEVTCRFADVSSSQCTSCANSSLFLVGQSCFPVCPFGQYLAVNNSCSPCDPSCESCVGPDSNQCLSCNKSMYLTGSPGTCTAYTCHATLVTAGCMACSGTELNHCVKPGLGMHLDYKFSPVVYNLPCIAGQYFNTTSGTCDPCNIACLLCKGPANTDCIYCADNMIKLGASTCLTNPNHCDLWGGFTIDPSDLTCQACTDTNCRVCGPANFCFQCDIGYFATTAGLCTACSADAVYCQKQTGLPLLCRAGYVFYDQSDCVPICDSNQYLNNKTYECMACNWTCLSCAGNNETCTDCRPGDYLYSRPIPFTYKRPCNVLANVALGGYFLSGAVALPCTFPCLTCLTTGTNCQSCYRGYFLNGAVCTKCTAPCYECSGSATTCTSCHMGYELIVSTCSQICEDYEYFNTTISYCVLCPPPCKKCNPNTPTNCLSCYNGFVLSGTSCVQCHETCETCTGPLNNQCSSCPPYLTLNTGKCLRTCPLNSYYYHSAGDCFFCHPFCKTCSGPSPYNCTTCLTGYTLETNAFVTDNTTVTTGFCKKTCAASFTLQYPYPNECARCPYACTACSSSGDFGCTACLTGFYLNNGRCEKCHPFCATCSGPSPSDCLTCPVLHSLDAGYCKPSSCGVGARINYAAKDCTSCHGSCASCTGPLATDCYTCPTGRLLIGATMTCVSSCPVSTFYNLAALACQACDASCLTCTGPLPTDCTMCFTGGYKIQVNSSLCASGCNPRSYLDPLFPNNCQPCHASCDTCLGGLSTNCSSCFTPQVLDLDNSCQPQCSPGYFEANPGVCGPCGYNCKTCTVRGPSNCTSCFSDSYLRQDGACYMYCALGTFYDPVMQFCQACDFSCKNCSGYSPTECLSCQTGVYLLPDGSCQKNCPARTYIKDGVSCHACSTTCETCTGETEKDCSLCASGLFMTANSTCLPECDLRFFSEPKSRKCLACDPTCVTCTGEGKDQCLSCANPEYCSLTQTGTCIDCSEKAEEYPDLCTTTGILKLEEALLSLVDDVSSATVVLSFANSPSFIDRFLSLDLKKVIKISIKDLEDWEFNWKMIGKQQRILIYFNFSIEVANPSVLSVTPLQKVIMKNGITNATDLIFLNRTAILKIQITKAPDANTISSIKNMASSAESSSGSFAYVAAALCASVAMFPSLVSPLMKLFRVFKILSRLRLINIFFGQYLEIFLTVCNMLFTLGGDDISKSTLESAPDTRGKLTSYRVTPISVEVITIKVIILSFLFAFRIYRQKIRTYAVKTSSLTTADSLINRVAESARITMIASLSLDVLFYSCHSIVHLRWTYSELTDNAKHSIWLGCISVFFIVGDAIVLLLENQECHFTLLRKEFRMHRKMQASSEKEKQVQNLKPDTKVNDKPDKTGNSEFPVPIIITKREMTIR